MRQSRTSFLEIPKKIFLNVEWEDEIHIEEPVKRAPYFAIMAIQTEIILQLLATLDVYDNKELIIKSWVINQIVDPLDKNRLTGEIYNKAMKDERFFEEIYSGLYILLEKTFLNLEKLGGDIELLIKIIDETFFIILSNYFLDQKESAFTLMKQINDELNLTSKQTKIFIFLDEEKTKIFAILVFHISFIKKDPLWDLVSWHEL